MSGPTTDWVNVALDALDEDGEPRVVTVRMLDGRVEVEGFDRLQGLSLDEAMAFWEALRRTLAAVVDPLTPELLDAVVGGAPVPEPLSTVKTEIGTSTWGNSDVSYVCRTQVFVPAGTEVVIYRKDGRS